MINALQWLVSIACLIGGVFVMTMNWLTIYTWLASRKHSSWTPGIGGALFGIGIALIPLPLVRSYWWTGLLLDWGCLPGMLHAAVYLAIWRIKQ